MTLSGKTALVTGGTRGIGREITCALARSGADVLTCYRRDEEHASSLVRELKAIPGDHHVVQADLAQENDIVSLIDECRTRLGTLDIIVNCAGAISHRPFSGELRPRSGGAFSIINLTAACLVIQNALPLLSGNASIINIGSRVATVGIPLRAHYTAANAAVDRADPLAVQGVGPPESVST